MRTTFLVRDLAGVAAGAFDVAKSFQEEARAFVKERVNDTLREMDVVTRDEFDAVKTLALSLQKENESLRERLDSFEKLSSE